MCHFFWFIITYKHNENIGNISTDNQKEINFVYKVILKGLWKKTMKKINNIYFLLSSLKLFLACTKTKRGLIGWLFGFYDNQPL